MVCSETTKTVLDAGTWTNFGSTPKIFTEAQEIGALEDYIYVGEDTEDIHRSSDDTRIYANETCSLKLFSPNTTNRDNIIADIEAIFKASSEGIKLKSGNPSAVRDKYIREFIVELITTS